MEVIEGVELSKLCDYSFGDQSGQWGNIYTSFMKGANLLNTEFATKVFDISKERDYMTLFIDNIRLYKRDVIEVKPEDKDYVFGLMEESNLLKLCGCYPMMKFIIFTNLEDTPIDEDIFDAIPDNVLCISAVNAIENGGKVIPAPYGVQRRMNPSDDRIERLQNAMKNTVTTARFKLLYVNHNDSSHEDRVGLKHIFKDQEWAVVEKERVDYSRFLTNVALHKFILCPRGNAIDCHRNWEVLYMRRVPVMLTYPYLIELFKDWPVLWVSDYGDVTQDLLKANNHLYEEAREMDLSKLTLRGFFDNIVNEYAYGHG
tara:strand:+ start:657 stop:1601 length:945 start_codon:yes stop_codon:yes gene_type:complete